MHSFIRSSLAVTLSLVISPFALALPVEMQAFDPPTAPPDWVGFNNTPAPANLFQNSFGYSISNHTGGNPANEAGGLISRSAAVSYYADTDLGGSFDLSEAFMASGELELTTGGTGFNNEILIGHRSASTLTPLRDAAGLGILEPPGGANHRFRARISLANGTQLFGNIVHPNTIPLVFPLNGDYTFAYDYDPTAGVFSQGRLSAQVFNSSLALLGTSIIDLTAGDRAIGATFDAFGLGSGADINDDFNTINLFIDNLTYSVLVAPVPIPEPSTVVLLGLGLFGLAVNARRRRAA